MTKIISGTSNLDLSRKISEYLGIPLTKCRIDKFLDKEIMVEISEEIWGHDIFIVQSTCFPANDNLVELLLILDATKRAGSKTITLVVPYFGYGRQDRRMGTRAPISARLVAKMMGIAGTELVITIDLHSGQIEGFFDVPIEDLSIIDLLIQDIKARYSNIDNDKLAIVSPDTGRISIAKKIANLLQAEMVIASKIRARANESAIINIFGQYQGKDCIIIDDIVDSAGTLCNTADLLFKNGARSVSAYITHPVLSGNALEKINKSCLKNLIVTDTIPYRQIGNTNKISVISVAKILAQSIRRYAG
jgi:ribose-phosphate pyrophosphokinase